MRFLFFFIFLISIAFSYGQNTVTLFPELGIENNYSQSEYKYWKRATELFSKLNNLENEIKYSELTETETKAIDSLELGYGPQTDVIGCSWYCGGGPYKTSSSSVLNDDENYSNENIHDFDLFTGWVPQSKNGIGETISFHFKAKSPRINTIVIYNGYIKTKELWKKNSRAKKIKLKIDNETIAILELKDTTASQRFEIEPIQSTTENQDLVLTLEIMGPTKERNILIW